ncbi:XkdQ/YqbQ family protein [Cohnella silvisoli]|uniref:Phage portal protein n=1 Tax=Cohnella silvisoli TaxID=2873699 RepID=A0ABV1KMY2_9BACL|nr:phage portal protein [Cohnella silvisoli]MCD9020506.1 phage portal protein [Cohnella silvisoli]
MSYDVVLGNQFYLRDLVEEISLEDSLEEIAYKANIRLAVTSDMPSITPGQSIRISGTPYGGSGVTNLLHPGVVWDCSSSNSGRKHIGLTVYDRTIYLAKSEDERLMPAGQTASQRLKQYAKDWGIPIGDVTDTVETLARNIKRSQSIFSMIQEDLKETVDKGGDLFRPRMTSKGLELVKLGSNKKAWKLETLEDVTQNRTLEGAITQVKVLGAQTSEEKLSPVLAVEKKDTEKFGTLQKVIQDSKIETTAQAKNAAKRALLGIQETFSVTAPDINTIRAGDEVWLNGISLWVTRVTHRLGTPGHMDLELAAPNKVRRDYLA